MIDIDKIAQEAIELANQICDDSRTIKIPFGYTLKMNKLGTHTVVPVATPSSWSLTTARMYKDTTDILREYPDAWGNFFNGPDEFVVFLPHSVEHTFKLDKTTNFWIDTGYQKAKDKVEQACLHDWKLYNGFSESYNYCAKCAEKRELPK